ncbi:MAG: hypothetical protein ACKVT0_09560 [Planctomycetaceae bacterium]
MWLDSPVNPATVGEICARCADLDVRIEIVRECDEGRHGVDGQITPQQ